MCGGDDDKKIMMKFHGKAVFDVIYLQNMMKFDFITKFILIKEKLTLEMFIACVSSLL